jgi:hypothetical protein
VQTSVVRLPQEEEWMATRIEAACTRRAIYTRTMGFSYE